MDIIGIHDAVEKVCPFSLNERDTRTCITKECMAWEPFKNDRQAGVCLLIGEAPLCYQVAPKGATL